MPGGGRTPGSDQSPLSHRGMIPYSGSMVTLSSLCRSGSALSRPMLGLVMALVLALASILTMAERLRAEGAMQVVLCGTPGVEEVITLDAEGRPVTPVHHCPDCLVLTAAPGPAVPRLQLRAQMRVARFAPVLSRPSESLSPPPPAARGPPLTA